MAAAGGWRVCLGAPENREDPYPRLKFGRLVVPFQAFRGWLDIGSECTAKGASPLGLAEVYICRARDVQRYKLGAIQSWRMSLKSSNAGRDCAVRHAVHDLVQTFLSTWISKVCEMRRFASRCPLREERSRAVLTVCFSAAWLQRYWHPPSGPVISYRHFLTCGARSPAAPRQPGILARKVRWAAQHGARQAGDVELSDVPGCVRTGWSLCRTFI